MLSPDSVDEVKRSLYEQNYGDMKVLEGVKIQRVSYLSSDRSVIFLVTDKGDFKIFSVKPITVEKRK